MTERLPLPLDLGVAELFLLRWTAPEDFGATEGGWVTIERQWVAAEAEEAQQFAARAVGPCALGRLDEMRIGSEGFTREVHWDERGNFLLPRHR